MNVELLTNAKEPGFSDNLLLRYDGLATLLYLLDGVHGSYKIFSCCES